MIINAKVSRENPRSYALWSEGSEVGWLRLGTLGFCRLPGSLGARRAAQIAAEKLAEWYRVRWQRSTPDVWAGLIAPELQVTVNGLVVGRLFKSLERPTVGDAGGFELRIPNDIWVATSVQLAQQIYTALHQVTPVIELVVPGKATGRKTSPIDIAADRRPRTDHLEPSEPLPA